MHAGPPPAFIVEELAERNLHVRRNRLLEREFDPDSHALSIFSMFGVACLISVFWVQTLTSIEQKDIATYDLEAQHIKYMGFSSSSFGPRLPQVGFPGVLFYNPENIHGCKVGYNYTAINQTLVVGLNSLYNRTFRDESNRLFHDDVVKQEEELTGGFSPANSAGGANTVQHFMFELNQHGSDWWETPILLVKRGGNLDDGSPCSFIDKVYLAQQAGVKAVVVYDDVQELKDANNQPRLVSMSAEKKQINTMSSITIPSVFVSKSDGEDLLHFIDPIANKGSRQRSSSHNMKSHQSLWRGLKTDLFWSRGLGDTFYLASPTTIPPSLEERDENGYVYKNSRRRHLLRSVSFDKNEEKGEDKIQNGEEETLGDQRGQTDHEEVISYESRIDIPKGRILQQEQQTSIIHRGVPIIIQKERSIDDVGLGLLSGFGFLLALCSCSTLVCFSLSMGRFSLLQFFSMQAAPRERGRFFGPRRMRRGVPEGVLSHSELNSLNSFIYKESTNSKKEKSSLLDACEPCDTMPTHQGKSKEQSDSLDDGEVVDGCSICLDAFKEGDKVIILPCFHKFHSVCVGEWLTKWNGTCPLCKQQALPTHVDFEDDYTVRGHSLPAINYHNDALLSVMIAQGSAQGADLRAHSHLSANYHPQPNVNNDELAEIIRQIELEEEEEAIQMSIAQEALVGHSDASLSDTHSASISSHETFRSRETVSPQVAYLYNPFAHITSRSSSNRSAEQTPLISQQLTQPRGYADNSTADGHGNSISNQRPSVFLPRSTSARQRALEVRQGYGALDETEEER